MKLPKRFSLGFLLLVVALIAGFLAGNSRGYKHGFDVVTSKNNNVRVEANVRYEFGDRTQETLAVEILDVQQGETRRLQGGKLGNLFVDITPYRIDVDEQAPSPNTKFRETTDVNGDPICEFTFALQNQLSVEAAQSVNDYFKGEKTSPLIITDPVTNTVTVRTGTKEQADQVATMLQKIDVRPAVYRANVTIGRSNQDGTTTYLSRPKITTLENLKARATIGREHPDPSKTQSLVVELMMRREIGE